ncbi:gamma-glutamyltranspeptidase [Lentibacillus halodurans]|uniref:Gamma-glutamyltranspeptidase n=1 Tax=Lentibacillus halodurans TaxID=237679 RepID=A0A1I0XFD7_9BACI|nr:gamma-glutamyltransferase [Lentibacillus halodurans]SFA99789.1 gamma-glutamyltranspeptidase [Lentibacillus halodurans]
MSNKWLRQLTSVFLIMLLVITAPVTVSAGDPGDPRQNPTAVGDGGAVATEHVEASKAAIEILKKGGNAIDAAVAAAAAQGVTRPFSGGIGGGGFMNIYLAEEDRSLVLDHVTETSENFGPDAFIDPETGELYPAAVRSSSGMATGIPGMVKAWEQALEEHGSMSLSEVLEPAIEVAEEGFAADPNFIRETRENADKFRLFESTSELYLEENGEVPEPGTIMKNPDLADTYRLIAEHGSEIFYEGEIAEAIIDTIHNPPVVDNPHREVLEGNMSMDDLRNYEVIHKDPTLTNYRDYNIYSVPPSSSGVTISEIMNILEGYGLENMSKTQAYHYFLEASRYAFADRSMYMGDPAHTMVPVKGLMSKGYAAERRQRISDDFATIGQVAPGNPWPYEEDPDKEPEPPEDDGVAFHHNFEGNDGEQWDPLIFADLHSWPGTPAGATFTIQENTGHVDIDERLQGNGSAYGLITPDMGSLNESELLVKFRFNELGNNQRLRLWIQADRFSSGSSMAENGYGIELRADDQRLILRGREDGSSTTYGSMDTDLSTEWHSLRLRTEGNQLSVRLWNDEMDEPDDWDLVHELSKEEKANNALGRALLSIINFDYNSGNTVEFDEITVNDLSDDTQMTTLEQNAANSQEAEEEIPTETIHLSVSDSEGNIVSYTKTINSIAGNGMVVPGYGFILNNGFSGRTPMQDPDHPNAPRPGLRMLSAMSPAIVTKDGEPVMTVGAPSSNRIITTIVQIIIGQLDFSMTLPEAINEPRLSQRNLSHASTQYEEIYLDEYGSLLDELKEMGHTFTADTAIQGISAATGLEFLDDGNVRAAAEPERRGGGSAMAIDRDEIEDPPPEESSVEFMIELVEDYERSGEIENHKVARFLSTHLISIEHYEQEEKIGKAIKHMEGFQSMLNHQEENNLISERAGDELKGHADNLLEQWQ